MKIKESELIFGLMASLGNPEYSVSQLKELLALFNVTENTLRTTLSRLTKKGLLISRKEGKSAFYRFSPKGTIIRSNVGRSFFELDWSNWDEWWWGVLFSVPERKRSERYRIHKKLFTYRFAPFHRGFWIRPRHPSEEIEKHLQSHFEHANFRLISFMPHREFTEAEVQRLWNIEKVAHKIDQALDLLLRELAKIDTMSAHEALIAEMEIGGIVVNTLFQDPLLPHRYLPADWKGSELRARFSL